MHALRAGLVIHDLDRAHFTEAQHAHHLSSLFSSGWRALETLKAQGEIKAYGAGINHVGNMTSFL
jgi:D-threo-aldose 1-dehydrogenase